MSTIKELQVITAFTSHPRPLTAPLPPRSWPARSVNTLRRRGGGTRLYTVQLDPQLCSLLCVSIAELRLPLLPPEPSEPRCSTPVGSSVRRWRVWTWRPLLTATKKEKVFHIKPSYSGIMATPPRRVLGIRWSWWTWRGRPGKCMFTKKQRGKKIPPFTIAANVGQAGGYISHGLKKLHRGAREILQRGLLCCVKWEPMPCGFCARCI